MPPRRSPTDVSSDFPAERESATQIMDVHSWNQSVFFGISDSPLWNSKTMSCKCSTLTSSTSPGLTAPTSESMAAAASDVVSRDHTCIIASSLLRLAINSEPAASNSDSCCCRNSSTSARMANVRGRTRRGHASTVPGFKPIPRCWSSISYIQTHKVRVC